jgi:hypothetical protein
MIRPEQFGAVGDGQTDDTAALQAALNRAQGSGVTLQARRYAIRDTLFVPTSSVLDGYGATIIQTSRDKPVLASLAWDGRGPTKGNTRIRGLRLQGNKQGERQHGIVLHDYWSEIVDVEVMDVGGYGVLLTHEDRNGRQPTGTLVENQIRNCNVRNSGRTAFWLGATANGKLTDGALINCIASLADNVREPGAFLGHAAGWTINGLHTYGGNPKIACEVQQSYFTALSNLYFEGFSDIGLALQQVQTNVQVTNANIMTERAAEGAAFIAASRHRDFDHPTAMLANVGLWYGGTTPVLSLRNDAAAVNVVANGVSVTGPGASRVAGAMQQRVTSGAPDVASQHRVKTTTWTGRGQQSIEIATRPEGETFEASFLVGITARSLDGGLTTTYSGMVNWHRADARDRTSMADIALLAPALGFVKEPVISVDRRAGRLVLLLSFTPVATGTGQLSVF